ncbi:MAG TPA: hypothetical protein VF273_08960 [Pelobium sp.]
MKATKNNRIYGLMMLIMVFVLPFSACKKDEPAPKDDLYPETPVNTPSSSAIAVFQKPDPFYQLHVYRYDPDAKKWTKDIGGHFSTISATDNTYLGFTNPYVTDSGVAMFDMVRLYSDYAGSSTIKTLKINADQVLQFFPDFEGAKTGIVKVKTQDITITKRDGGNFKIGISGQGTYDERTKVIDLTINFNNSAIGKPNTSYNYKLSVNELNLN